MVITGRFFGCKTFSHKSECQVDDDLIFFQHKMFSPTGVLGVFVFSFIATKQLGCLEIPIPSVFSRRWLFEKLVAPLTDSLKL
jgi:hypothetical protein